jgi:hypothetical protein
MASTLKHLRSSTANKRPTASGLADGQIAINTASGTPGMFFKDNNGTVVKVGPVHVGNSAPNAVPAGSAGNSTGELWVNNSTTINGLNYYNGSSFVNLTPSGTTTVAGLVELATAAETQTGTDAIRAVTPSGLQSKISDSTSTTSSTTIASSTAVKAAYDLADAALPKSGGRVTGNLEIGPTGTLSFEGSTDDNFETTLAVVNPTADRTITLPNVTGTVVTTGDTGSVTSTMIADGTIVNADINASAAIALSKLGSGALPADITVASANIVDGTIVNADINASAAIADTKLATISTTGKVNNSATTATSANTASAIVARDASGNFSAGTITGTLSGTATNCSRSVLAGNGLTGGGALSGNVTLTLGTPGSLTGSTTNSVTSTSHTHDITVNLGVTDGTTAGPTITSSAGTNATIPTASASAAGVVTTGNQTWAGTKTFNNSIVSPGITRADRVTISSTGGEGVIFIEAQNISTGNVRSVSTFNNTTTSTGNEVRIINSGTLQRISSSIKYKKDVETLEDQYVDAVIDNARPTWYRSKCESDNPDWGHYGFIAEELVQIDPRLVCLEPDENGSYLGADGNRYEPEGVQYQSIIPMLVNAIKRQKQAIETLEAKVAALEAASQ